METYFSKVRSLEALKEQEDMVRYGPRKEGWTARDERLASLTSERQTFQGLGETVCEDAGLGDGA